MMKKGWVGTLSWVVLIVLMGAQIILGLINSHQDDLALQVMNNSLLPQSWVRDYSRQHNGVIPSFEATIPSWGKDTWPVNPYSRQPMKHVLRSDRDYVGNFTYFQFPKGKGKGDVIVCYIPRGLGYFSHQDRFEESLKMSQWNTDSHYLLFAAGRSPEEVFQVLGQRWHGLNEPPLGNR